jgi:hypothetical protein
MSITEILLADTVTRLDERHRGNVIVAGSHGGVYAGYCAAKAGVRAVIFHDAKIGNDSAGIGSIKSLADLGIAAASADGRTCRIANSKDIWNHGVIIRVNEVAALLGCKPGMKVNGKTIPFLTKQLRQFSVHWLKVQTSCKEILSEELI